jgi:hypothetical protein
MDRPVDLPDNDLLDQTSQEGTLPIKGERFVAIVRRLQGIDHRLDIDHLPLCPD